MREAIAIINGIKEQLNEDVPTVRDYADIYDPCLEDTISINAEIEGWDRATMEGVLEYVAKELGE